MCVLILDVQAQQLDVQAHVESGPESRGLTAGAWTSMTHYFSPTFLVDYISVIYQVQQTDFFS
jgi:hypothetical protein